ncbi:MAG TPA: capsule biosynthesis protein CapK [Blastocatellia bacterium]|nr:capsule biosynthesis protein CapK [Blastocatellia bacterium]
MSRNLTLTDEERFPLLTQEGRRLLEWMWEHPHAPRYNHRCGDMLTRDGLQRVRDYEAELNAAQKGWAWGESPAWVTEFTEWCLADVPFYRRKGGSAGDFFSLPTCDRADLNREPWAFVPDSQPLDYLIVYDTTGTTGHPLHILSHPEVSSKYLPALRAALATRGVRLEGDKGKVSIITVCAQNLTFTYASVSSYLDEAGFIKLNLNPHEWKDPDDRVRFLDECNPEIYTGDPISFLALAQLPLKTRPKALVSTAMKLLDGLKKELEDHFGCPVLDVYSMNESRLIAVSAEHGYEIVPHDLYVEILGPEGNPCRPGERGEVTLTGGRNPFLPLLRYRTGDYAAMEFRGRKPLLVGLEGREPVVFIASDGKLVNNIDVSYILKPFALSQFSLHQAADRSLIFKMHGHVDPEKVRAALLKVFGPDQPLTIEELTDADTRGGKALPYTTEIKGLSIHQAEMKFQRMTYQQVMNP